MLNPKEQRGSRPPRVKVRRQHVQLALFCTTLAVIYLAVIYAIIITGPGVP